MIVHINFKKVSLSISQESASEFILDASSSVTFTFHIYVIRAFFFKSDLQLFVALGALFVAFGYYVHPVLE